MADLAIGSIIVWPAEDMPDGWHLCDGTDGTPDLRGRLVQCAGNSYAPGESGDGANGVSVPSHTHTPNYDTTNGWPNHYHAGSFGTSSDAVGADTSPNGAGIAVAMGIAKTHAHTVSTTVYPVGYHKHGLTGTTGSQSASGMRSYLPSCVALYYIQRLS